MDEQARQDLIERAAKALASSSTGWKVAPNDPSLEWRGWLPEARTALAVFEEAANVSEPPITDIPAGYMSLEKVTRITVAGPEGIVFERYDLYPGGVDLLVQDEGRTLKVLPRVAADERQGAPDGWFPFGTFANSLLDVSVQFSDEKGEDGLPLWERPVPHMTVVPVQRQVQYNDGEWSREYEVGTAPAPYTCICGNDCEPPEWTVDKRDQEFERVLSVLTRWEEDIMWALDDAQDEEEELMAVTRRVIREVADILSKEARQ